MSPRYVLVISLVFFGMSVFCQVRTIDFYITAGISNSPLLKDLNNQVKAHSIDSLLIKANRLPKVAFNGTLYYAPIINDYGYSEAVTNGGIFSTLVTVSQELFTAKTTEAQYAQLGIQNLSLANTGKITENDLKKEITSQYLDVCFLSKELNSSLETLKSLENEDAILRQFTEKGIYRQTEYLSFYLELQSQRLSYHEAMSQYRKELYQLNLLCGISDTSVVALSMPSLEMDHAANPLLSPYFLRFKLDSLGIQNEKTILDRNYKPKISWFTDAGLLNNVPGDIYKNFGISLGLNFSLPVYDGNQRKLNYQKLKNTEETRKNYQDYFVHQYDARLQQLRDELAQTKFVIPEIEHQAATASLLLKEDEELLSKGGLPVTEYITTIKSYISIRQNLNEYQKRILQIINEINYWKQ